jgi:hypothetical protein
MQYASLLQHSIHAVSRRGVDQGNGCPQREVAKLTEPDGEMDGVSLRSVRLSVSETENINERVNA